MPMGSSVLPRIIRATTSHHTRKMEPTMAEITVTLRWSEPTTMRTTWGMMSPTKPMVPDTATTTPVRAEETTR